MDTLKRYMDLYKDLEFLIKEGKESSEAASNIRELMDMVWPLLTEEELEELKKILTS